MYFGINPKGGRSILALDNFSHALAKVCVWTLVYKCKQKPTIKKDA